MRTLSIATERRKHQRYRALRKHEQRSGVATVELAVCLMPLVLIMVGTVDICQMLHLRQEATLIAFEGARVRARKGSTTATATSRCETLLSQRRISEGTVAINFPEGQSSYASFTVTVTVPIDDNVAFGLYTSGSAVTVTRRGKLEYEIP